MLQNKLPEALDNLMKSYILYIEMNSPYKADAEMFIAEIYKKLEATNQLDVFNKLAKKYHIQIKN